MTIIKAPPVWPIGYPSVKVARNGSVPGALQLAQVGGLMNAITARRQRLLFSKNIMTTALPSGAGPDTIFYTYVVTSPNAKAIMARVLYAPAPNTYYATGAPYFRFNVALAPGSKHLANIESGTAYAGYIQDHRYQDIHISDNVATAELPITFEVGNGAQVFSVVIYEVPRSELNDEFLLGVDTRKFSNGSGIYGEEWSRLSDAVMSVARLQSTVHFAWSVNDGSPVTEAAGTETNVVDGDTGGWASTAKGFYAWLLGRQRQFSANICPVRLWAYAGVNSGTGEVVFRYSQGELGRVQVTGAADVYTLDTTIECIYSKDLITVEVVGGGGTTTSVYAAGMMDYEA